MNCNSWQKSGLKNLLKKFMRQFKELTYNNKKEYEILFRR
jgi:hypothetical protein